MQHTNVSRISTVVFDFGGVFTASPIALARRTATEVGVDADQLVELMMGDYAAESDHPWQRVERGEIALEEARVWARLETRHRLGIEIDPMVVMEPLMREPVRSSMIALATEIRASGRTTALLTNNARELRGHWGELADWDSIFDQIIDSSEVGVRKPTPEAFALTLDRCAEPDASRAVMIDDFGTNIDGARAFGMHGVLVGEDPDPAIAEVRELVLS